MSNENWTIKILKLVDGNEIISLIKINPEEPQKIYPLKFPFVIHQNKHFFDEEDLDELDDLEEDYDMDNEKYESFSYNFIFNLIPYSEFSKNGNVEITPQSIIYATDPNETIETFYKTILTKIVNAKNEQKEYTEIEDTILAILLDESVDDKYENELQKWFNTDTFKGIKINN